MGKQYNKVIKRRRRKAYLNRKKALLKAGFVRSKAKGKVAEKSDAKKSVAKKAPVKKAAKAPAAKKVAPEEIVVAAAAGPQVEAQVAPVVEAAPAPATATEAAAE
jgi:hypothetical protein